MRPIAKASSPICKALGAPRLISARCAPVWTKPQRSEQLTARAARRSHRSPRTLAAALFGAGASSKTRARLEAWYQHIDFLDHSWQPAACAWSKSARQPTPMFCRRRTKRALRFSFGGRWRSNRHPEPETTRYALGAQSVQQRGSVEQRFFVVREHEERASRGASPVTSRALILY